MAQKNNRGKMKVTVLGCGTSTGVPLIQCKCKVCQSKNLKNKRLRSSIWIQVDGKSLLVDTTPDLRQQALRAGIKQIDAVLYTHPHADHTAGIDEMRSFNFIQKKAIPIFAHEWTLRELVKRYSYIFKPGEVSVQGGGTAKLVAHEFSLEDATILVEGVSVVPLALAHGTQWVAGFRIGSFAYLTDVHFIPEKTIERLHGIDVLMLDCLRLQKHDTHLHYEQALEYSRQVGAKKTVFTHMGHDFDYVSFSKKLPKNHSLAYDGLTVTLKE